MRLNAALAAAPKTKAQKEAELKKKQDEEKKLKDAEARERKEALKKVSRVEDVYDDQCFVTNFWLGFYIRLKKKK